jgi:hypothetical protein
VNPIFAQRKQPISGSPPLAAASRLWVNSMRVFADGSNIGSSRSNPPRRVNCFLRPGAPSACFRNRRAGRFFRWRGRRRYVLFDQVPKHCREQEGDQLRAPVFQGQSDKQDRDQLRAPVFRNPCFHNHCATNFRDTLAKCSEANPKRVSIADLNHAICRSEPYFAAAAISFWKRGSLRSGFRLRAGLGRGKQTLDPAGARHCG